MQESLRFLTPEKVIGLAETFGSPLYVYDGNTLRANASRALGFPASFGLTVRYAMKASPNASILRLFDAEGLHVDASSGYEVRRAILAGVSPGKISLSTQEYPAFFDELHEQGIEFNACSLNQLKLFGEAHRGGSLGIRVNPGVGSGGTAKTNVGGPSSSFGIWHEQLDEVDQIVSEYKLTVKRIHTHIGSGSDPDVWRETAKLSIDVVRRYTDVTVLNLGGGYKVGRMNGEVSTDLKTVGEPVRLAFEQFAEETGRKIHLEIEPGTFLVANACSIISRIQDKVSTGEKGHVFLKLDSGMTDLLRPSLYGAQHPVIVVPRKETSGSEHCVVVGHCCESGDLVTPVDGEPEVLGERELMQSCIGDYCVIEGTGAYCSSMSTSNYNSFPQTAEVLLDGDGNAHLIRERQTLDQITCNEKQVDIT